MCKMEVQLRLVHTRTEELQVKKEVVEVEAKHTTALQKAKWNTIIAEIKAGADVKRQDLMDAGNIREEEKRMSVTIQQKNWETLVNNINAVAAANSAFLLNQHQSSLHRCRERV